MERLEASDLHINIDGVNDVVDGWNENDDLRYLEPF
jgi:hypothetical protein